MVKVFVYGKLLKGMSRSDPLADVIFLGNASTEGPLYDLGPFTAILGDEGTVYVPNPEKLTGKANPSPDCLQHIRKG